MPESDRPERAREIDEALDRLTASVERILADYEAIRSRSNEMQREYVSLREAVGQTGGADSGDLQGRLSTLAAENKALREILVAARGRAQKIRSQLALVEDEV
jgi:predicted nuclease with TOPRIM domain